MAVKIDFSLHFHLFFTADPEEYNCSVKTEEEWEREKESSIVVGSWFILLSLASLGIYLLLFLAMTSKEILHNSCFKLMYFNCLIDCGSIACGGLITGWLFIRGDVFCTNTFWTFAPGALGLGCWSASCVLCLSLALSRICAMHRFEWVNTTYVVIVLSMCHCVFMMFCTRTIVFNAPRGSWFFSPYIQEDSYANSYHLTENLLVAVITPIMYVYVCVKLFYHPANQMMSKSNRRLQISACLQSFLVCSLVCIAAVLFAYMQIFSYPPWMPLSAEIAYQICGTLPAAVLLLVNKRIRMRAKCILLRMNPSTVAVVSRVSGIISKTGSGSRRTSRVY